MDEIEQAVTLEYFLPQVAGSVSVGINGVPLTARIACSIAALVKGEKMGRTIRQLCGHPHFVEIDSEVNQKSMVQTECKFFRAAIIFELIDGAGIVLSGELVLQF